MDEMQTNEKKELTIAQECNSIQSTVAGSFKVIFQKLSPERIQSADDAKALASLSEVVGQRFTMINRRAMYIVYKRELWKSAVTITGKPYKNYTDWAKHSFGLASSQAYNVAAVGAYVKEDGNGTIFDMYGNKWDFTKLLVLLQSKELFTRNKDKQYTAITVPAWEKDLDENGVQRAVIDNDGKVKGLWKESVINDENADANTPQKESVINDENADANTPQKESVINDENADANTPQEESKAKMPLYELLMLTGAITSRMTVAYLKEQLKKQWTFDKYGAHGEDAKELKEAETPNESETTDESESMGESYSACDNVTAKSNSEDVGTRLSEYAKEIMFHLDEETPDLDSVREYAKAILAIAEKL